MSLFLVRKTFSTFLLKHSILYVDLLNSSLYQDIAENKEIKF